MTQQERLDQQLYRIGLAAMVLGGLFVWIFFWWIWPNANIPPCVLYQYLGIYCPGCGGTRAVWALLHGHILKSLWLHPLVPYSAFLFGGFMLTQTLEKLHFGRVKGWHFHNWYLYGAVGIIFLNWILKNILRLFFDITL